MDNANRLAMVRNLLENVIFGTTTTVPIAGKLLGLSRNKAYEAAAKGEIPTLRFGKRIIVPTAPLRRMLGIDDPSPRGGAR